MTIGERHPEAWYRSPGYVATLFATFRSPPKKRGVIAQYYPPLPQPPDRHRNDIADIDRVLIDLTRLGQDRGRIEEPESHVPTVGFGRQITLRSISTVSSRICALAESAKIFLVLYAFIAE